VGAMAILLALNEFNVLTGEPHNIHGNDAKKHHNHQHGEHYESSDEEHLEEDWTEWKDWRESADELGVSQKITYQNFNAEALPFPDESYDGIFMYDSLQHIQNRKRALIECLRVLSPSGVLCVIEWNKKAIEIDREKYGFEIDYIDPRDILNRSDLSVDTNSGDILNFYVIQKT
jgi:SAM-dependent methyltransferase